MGSMGGKGAPAPPDFQGIAQNDVVANRPTQGTPWGTSQWTRQHTDAQMPPELANMRGSFGDELRQKWTAAHPDQTSWSQQTNLSPELQGANQSAMGQLNDAWSTPLDNGAQARQHAEDAIYGRETSRLDPQWQQQQSQFTSGLTNQGIDPNSKAGQDAYMNFNRAKNDAYQQAQYGAITGGGQEAERQQGMDLRSRAAPLVGMQGLQGLTGMPGFAQSGLLPAAMAQYQGALQNYGIQQQGKNSTLNGLMGLGGTLGAAAL